MNRALINASSGIVQKPLRYVLYVRKSSEDAEAQAKSLLDQIADCKEYANNHDLLLVGEPIQESKSAKKSGNRPLFSQMLKDIEKGKYEAILACGTQTAYRAIRSKPEWSSIWSIMEPLRQMASQCFLFMW